MRTLCVAVLMAAGLLTITCIPVQGDVEDVEPEAPAFRVGIGAKVLGGSPFAVVAGSIGQFGMEGGVGFSSETIEEDTISLMWYSLLARYYIGIPQVEFLRPYGSAGVVGLTASTTVEVEVDEQVESFDISIATLGFDAAAGVEFHIGPVAVFGGLDWLMFGDITINLGDVMEITAPWDLSGPSYHVGVRYDF